MKIFSHKENIFKKYQRLQEIIKMLCPYQKTIKHKTKKNGYKKIGIDHYDFSKKNLRSVIFN